jgi:GxxExxY protein
VAELLYKQLSFDVIGAAMEVHRVMGPGFLEEVYQKALERELAIRHVPFVAQQHFEVEYKGTVIAEYYLDIVVDQKIVLELKAVSQLLPVHQSQLISYLKASGLKLGLLLNFGEESLRHKRIALTEKDKNFA